MKSLRLLGPLLAVALLQFGCSTVPETGDTVVVWAARAVEDASRKAIPRTMGARDRLGMVRIRS